MSAVHIYETNYYETAIVNMKECIHVRLPSGYIYCPRWLINAKIKNKFNYVRFVCLQHWKIFRRISSGTPYQLIS